MVCKIPDFSYFVLLSNLFYLKAGAAGLQSHLIEYAICDAGRWLDDKNIKEEILKLKFLSYQAKTLVFKLANLARCPVPNQNGISTRVTLAGVGHSHVILKAD